MKFKCVSSCLKDKVTPERLMFPLRNKKMTVPGLIIDHSLSLPVHLIQKAFVRRQSLKINCKHRSRVITCVQ